MNETHPIFFRMPPAQFAAELEAKQQQVALESSEIEKNNELARQLRRDGFKSELRIQERFEKERVKRKSSKIVVIDEHLIRQTFCAGKLLLEELVCDWSVDEVRMFRREGGELEVMVKFRLPGIATTICSPLVPPSIIMSKRKLHDFVVACLDKRAGDLEKDVLEVIQKDCLSLMDRTKIQNIPSKPGWFGDYGFCAKNNGKLPDFLQGTTEMAYCLKGEQKKDKNEACEKIVNAASQMKTETYGMAFLLHIISAFLSLFAIESLGTEVFLIGNKAKDFAVSTLSICTDSGAIPDLGVNKWKNIVSAALARRDTPFIVSIQGESGLSNLKRIREAFRAGSIDGKPLQTSLVVCAQYLFSRAPIDGSLLISADSFALLERGLFDDFTRLIIDYVGQAPSYWKDFLQKAYKRSTLRNRFPEIENVAVLCVADAIIEMMQRVMQDENFQSEYREEILTILNYGAMKIREQLRSDGMKCLPLFKEAVLQMTCDGRLCYQDVREKYTSRNETTIFYDKNKYFFRKEVFEKIIFENALDDKSGIRIKRELAEENFLKVYESNFGNREFMSDFTIINENGIQERMSGLAIRREFFVETAGVGLEERI